MPSIDEIRDLDDSTLDDLEREFVRQILNITGKAGTATYIESEARMNLLTPSQCQVVRALLLDYSDIQFDTTKAQGNGKDYDPQRDKAYIANELRRMLYPSAVNDDPSLENGGSYVPAGTLTMVRAEYAVGSDELS
jgi:hypothetical protein